MRTRSGFILGKRRRGQESANMADDTQSTDAQWGTPHTTSFSTMDSHPRSPLALSPVTENPPPRSNRSASRHLQDGGNGQDTASYAQPAQPTQYLSTPHAMRSTASQQPRHYRPLRSNQPQHSNREVDEEDDSNQTPHASGSHEVMRRYSESERPWNHTIAGEKRSFSDVNQEQHPPDRNYPDKLEKELEELEKGGDDKDSDGSKPKKHKKVRRGRGKGYDRTGMKGSNRRNEYDGSDEDGNGGVRA